MSGQPSPDLSSLPPALRQQVEASLARLPPEMRQAVLEKGSPVLRKAIERAAANDRARATPPASRAGPGHFNNTVAPGDGSPMRFLLLAFAALAALLGYWWLR